MNWRSARGDWDGPIWPLMLFGAPILTVYLAYRGARNVIGWAGDNPALALLILIGLVGFVTSIIWLRKKESQGPHWSEIGIKED